MVHEPGAIDRVVDAFGGMGIAQIHDASPDQVEILDPSVVLRTPSYKLAGPVFPVVTCNDVLPGLQAIEAAPPGWVPYVHDQDPHGDALAGDVLVTAVKEQGLGGLVIDGAIRDLEYIQDLGVAVFSRRVRPVSARTEEPTASVPAAGVDLGGGVVLRPGDWLFGDLDGLALVPASAVSDIVVSGQQIFARETEIKAQLRAGRRLASLTGSEEFAAARTPMVFRP